MSLLEIIVDVVSKSLPEPHAGLLLGMLFGIKATLSKSFLDSLIATGTIHIVALSGMNITMLIAFVQAISIRYIKRPIANYLSIMIIIGFVFLVGVSASVVRAAIMGCISLLAINLGRKNIPLYALILAVICMLMLNPLWVIDTGFQLSVCATLGIILFANKDQIPQIKRTRVLLMRDQIQVSKSDKYKEAVSELFRKMYGFIGEDLRVTLAAQVFTIPVIIYTFHRVSLVAPLANVLIGWLIAPIMLTGFCMVIVGLIWQPLAIYVGSIVWALITLLIYLIELCAGIPFSNVGW
jgi:competence protein ComEC